MKLYNTLTRNAEELQPLEGDTVRIYSCGPTVYDHAHIGNLSAYIFADMLRRAIKSAGFNTLHAMNYTDVDDKTIRRSREKHPGDDPKAALKQLTDHYIGIFLNDMQQVGNDVQVLHFLRATDPEVIKGMQELIARLHAEGFAYIADDGVYFSIDAYRKSGKRYGQLLELTLENTSEARIQNDEYDKESAHDFALWKRQKDGEPAWEFTLDGHDLTGRPGWHIECSIMSQQALGQPFDIHTGGVDLIFPHHENEIAQSTAGEENPTMARFFAHNEHILVDGKKMAKSAGNFYTLQDVIKRGYDPLAFRLLVLQGHYRSQVHLSWELLQAAQNRLKGYQQMADQRWQARDTGTVTAADLETAQNRILAALQDDLNTPVVLAELSQLQDAIDTGGISTGSQEGFVGLLQWLDSALGLHLADGSDITGEQKQLIREREAAREAKDWAKSDQLRDQLTEQGIGLRDKPFGAQWYRV